MNMLPIFIIGLIVGIAVSYAWYMYKKSTPSEVQLHVQEAEIIRYKNDISQLEKLNEKLYKEIAELKNELEHKK